MTNCTSNDPVAIVGVLTIINNLIWVGFFCYILNRLVTNKPFIESLFERRKKEE